ncbi:MAG: right-handed parallel beta-helix repeat-containing protein [Candidatus Bathyarchaeia archaeon]
MQRKHLCSAITILIITTTVLMAATQKSKNQQFTILKIKTAKGEPTENQTLIINVNNYTGTDQEKIQKALNSVPLEGATVYIPEGTWVAYNLTAKSKTIIMGSGKTTIKRPANTTLPFITFVNASNFAIINITFDGQNITDATGIYITNSINFLIFNNTFKDISRNALRITGQNKNFTIKNNTFINTNNAPLIIFGSPGTREITNFTITNNLVTNSPENGKIAIAFASDGKVFENTITNSQYGIGTRGISNIIIENNIITNCTSYGIYLGTQPADPGSWNITIANNQITNNKIGISRYYGSEQVKDVKIINNQITNNTEYDIQADFQATIINNTFTSKQKIKIIIPPTDFLNNKDPQGKTIMPADINNDGKVDAKDIGTIASLFGATPETQKWNQTCDIIQNDIIDSKDLAFACKYFGKTC